MALNSKDKKLVDEVSASLRLRFQDQVRWDGVTQEEFDGQQYNVQMNSASTPVVLTKEELRENSDRRIARGAYLNEIASAFNQKMGIVARADLDEGVVYAQAVPDAHDAPKPMTREQLNAEAQRAKARLANDE